MNRGDIRKAILSKINYSPDDTAYHKVLNTQINDVYQEIFSDRVWPFSIKEVQLPALPDITEANYLYHPYATVTHGDVIVDWGQDVLHPWYVGQIIELDGVEYTIANISGTSRLFLDRPYRGTSSTSLSNWKIKNRFINLPDDCVQIQEVYFSDAPVPGSQRRSPIPLQPQAMHRSGLSQDQTGNRPTHYYHVPDIVIPAPQEILAPTLTLSSTTTGGALTPGSVLRFTYAYCMGEPTDDFTNCPEGPVWQGNDTWPNGYVEITIPSVGSYTINWAVFLPQSKYPAGGTGSWHPYYIHIYNVNPGYDKIHELTELRASNETGPLIDTTGTLRISADSYTPATIDRAVEHTGHTKRIQLYPRPSSLDKSIVIDPTNLWYNESINMVWVTYTYRPLPLVTDADVPELPPEYHQLIVNKVAAMQALKLEQTATYTMCNQDYDRLYARMVAAYGNNSDTRVQRGQSMLAFPHKMYGRQGLVRKV